MLMSCDQCAFISHAPVRYGGIPICEAADVAESHRADGSEGESGEVVCDRSAMQAAAAVAHLETHLAASAAGWSTCHGGRVHGCTTTS